MQLDQSHFEPSRLRAVRERFISLVRELHGIDPSEHIFIPESTVLDPDKNYKTLGIALSSVSLEGSETQTVLSDEEQLDYALLYLAKKHPQFQSMLDDYDSQFFTVVFEESTKNVIVLYSVPEEHKNDFVEKFYDLAQSPAEVQTTPVAPPVTESGTLSNTSGQTAGQDKYSIFEDLDNTLAQSSLILPALDETAYKHVAGNNDYCEILLSFTNELEKWQWREVEVSLNDLIDSFSDNAEKIVPAMEKYGAFIFDICDRKAPGDGSPDSPFAKRAYFSITLPEENCDGFLIALENAGVWYDLISEGELKDIAALELASSGYNDNFETDTPADTPDTPSTNKPIIH